MDNKAVFTLLADELMAGRRAILVSIISVTGSSMRDIGAHMAVAQDGRFVGSLSGGCIEQAVVAEALQSLTSGAAKTVRFGAGSDYIDIKLPCGGGLDVHFQPLKNTIFANQCLNAINRRAPFSMRLAAGVKPPEFIDRYHPHTIADDHYIIGHIAAPRLLIIGHGAAMVRLANLAQSIDLEVVAATPQDDIHEQLLQREITTHKLMTLRDDYGFASDPWTAIIFLFHDHDWETYLLATALNMPHFYIGAMGGKTAHQNRVRMLKLQGVSQQKIASLHAPIGLFHSARDPDTLAISVLSQIMQCYQNIDNS